MKDAAPKAIFLKDYMQPPYWIQTVDLRFELGEDETHVTSILVLKRNEAISGIQPLTLHGEELVLAAIRLDGVELKASEYKVDETELLVYSVPAEFTLEIETII